jgi:hypothetical protein
MVKRVTAIIHLDGGLTGRGIVDAMARIIQ